ncbi:MAG: hypothetical protein LBG52_02675 [Candidatus Peribacteria bacterium]|nr:hypothetical protein [Candidatus Peribacteria bacterium]
MDKYFGEFSDVVKVDASPLTSSAYEATSGSTTISNSISPSSEITFTSSSLHKIYPHKMPLTTQGCSMLQ